MENKNKPELKGEGGGQFTRHFIVDILSCEAECDSPLNLSTTSQEDSLRNKKQRTSFSGWQIYELERIFEDTKYINSEERKSIGSYLGVSSQQVKIWFQNRRTKWKRLEHLRSQQS